MFVLHLRSHLSCGFQVPLSVSWVLGLMYNKGPGSQLLGPTFRVLHLGSWVTSTSWVPGIEFHLNSPEFHPWDGSWVSSPTKNPGSIFESAFLTRPKQKKFDLFLIFVNLYRHTKIKLFHWFVLEKWLIQKSCNMIGWEHFDLYLGKNIFLKYRIWVWTQQIIKTFFTEQIQWKLMTKCFFKFKNFLAHFPKVWDIFSK